MADGADKNDGADAGTSTGVRVVSASRVIPVEPAAVFDVLADPARHHVIDGSGMVRSGRDGNLERLSLGSRFGMDMMLPFGLPYHITNEVVEFDENRRIAWRHLGHHIWRYQLTPVEGGTRVTESFDWSRSRFPPLYRWMRWPAKNQANMVRTLERLDDHLTGQPPAEPSGD